MVTKLEGFGGEGLNVRTTKNRTFLRLTKGLRWVRFRSGLIITVNLNPRKIELFMQYLLAKSYDKFLIYKIY